MRRNPRSFVLFCLLLFSSRARTEWCNALSQIACLKDTVISVSTGATSYRFTGLRSETKYSSIQVTPFTGAVAGSSPTTLPSPVTTLRTGECSALLCCSSQGFALQLTLRPPSAVPSAPRDVLASPLPSSTAPAIALVYSQPLALGTREGILSYTIAYYVASTSIADARFITLASLGTSVVGLVSGADRV